MSTPSQPSEPDRGYLSLESKRRFTLVTGILGALFFIAQFMLPFLVMFAIVMPGMMLRDLAIVDLDHAALFRGELWVIERSTRMNWRNPEGSATTLSLARVLLTDLSAAGPAQPLDGFSADSSPALLAMGDRLWIVGSEGTGYYENGAFTRLPGAIRPSRSSRPFAYGGRVAVIELGSHPAVATLTTEGGHAEWISRDLALALPAGGGVLAAAQAVESGGSLYLFAKLCTDSPEQCALSYRKLDGQEWLPVVDDLCSCADWTAIALPSGPAVVLSEQGKGRADRPVIVALTAGGRQRQEIETGTGHKTWTRWHPFPHGTGVLLLSEEMPGDLRLREVEDGRVIRSAQKTGSFPSFGPHMMLLMALPQLLPIVLSLLLAFLLTLQMRRHRVAEYVVGAERRTFATLWQRALAQLVDLVPLLAGFLAPGLWIWRVSSDPGRFVDEGAGFPLWFFGLFAGAVLWVLLVLVAYSYLEGRYGKTPGKWLLRIRVLGADLRPCGFGRALVRNLLTWADGFFSFMVGAMLVALTENWQRLGDLAARTIVIADRKAESVPGLR